MEATVDKVSKNDAPQGARHFGARTIPNNRIQRIITIMTEKLFKEKYPIHTIEISKSNMEHPTMDTVVTHYKDKVRAHPVATYIGIFDHYAHTASLPDGKVASEILAAKDVILCFGKELMHPEVLAVRPRAIGIAEMRDHFVISFLEAPNPAANEAMRAWTKVLVTS